MLDKKEEILSVLKKPKLMSSWPLGRAPHAPIPVCPLKLWSSCVLNWWKSNTNGAKGHWSGFSLGAVIAPPIRHSHALLRQGYGALRAHMGPGGAEPDAPIKWLNVHVTLAAPCSGTSSNMFQFYLELIYIFQRDFDNIYCNFTS